MSSTADRIAQIEALVAELRSVESAAAAGGSDELLSRHVAAMEGIAALSRGASLMGYQAQWAREHGGHPTHDLLA